VHITVVYDSYPYNPAARVSSGFACFLKTAESTLLFDTGIHGPTLLYNMEQLGLNPQEIDTIVISHIDEDHVGGLFSLLEENHGIMVYVPQSFPPAFKDQIALQAAKVIEVSRRRAISPGIETTGEMGTWIREQALMVRTERGIIVIVGDSHNGVLNIIKKTKKQTRENVFLLLGGFSLGSASPEGLKSVVKSFRRLGVEKVAPCHSSGDKAREIFQDEYKENYIECGVGKVIEL